eukprot:CAMPEP_0201710370 /NCGR_PEP_ID=MMETSP0578-20130828/58597_1 /ASSEMBLY_ACC=CAM_ASM_000663 /TAXON_ID=267565 /ORGANISM="Skeletonema grethea, Strain CCMP 1804" /LENGTH=520 /DNA_ID=CAMNT_0048199401 /DNA_START=102 /DNA_END=1665 /DNA_ORIENTATION=-
MKKFERLRHIRYFSHSLRSLPKQYSSADTNRLSLVHFCVQSLDILGCLPVDKNDELICGRAGEDVHLNREEIVEWIYGLETVPTTSNTVEANGGEECCVGGGFKGGTYLGPISDDQSSSSQRHPYDHSHIAMTYVALCTLLSLGDDLSRIDKHAILSTLQGLQKPNGSFVALSPTSTKYDKADDVEAEDDCDLRFMYAAIAVWYILTSLDQDQDEDQDEVSNTDDNINGKKDYINVEAEDDCDLRFMYAAIAVWYILTSLDQKDQDEDSNANNNINGKKDYINIESATNYILSCKSYEGALGLTPGREGHGGSTFCGIASLCLLGVLDDVMSRDDLRGWKEDLIYWCVMRQKSLRRRNKSSDGNDDDDDATTNHNNNNNNGYHVQDDDEEPAGMVGRPNKKEDTCYSYWIGGTLHLLSSSHLIDGWALREYVLTCQSPYGGFGKVVGAMPDLLHSFYSMAWLTLSTEDGCCDDDEENEEGDDGENVVYENEMRSQVRESIGKLSRLDCALGMCAKRMSTR